MAAKKTSGCSANMNVREKMKAARGEKLKKGKVPGNDELRKKRNSMTEVNCRLDTAGVFQSFSVLALCSAMIFFV